MIDDQNDRGLLPWTTPMLEMLGTMDDVHNDGGGDNDLDGLPMDPIAAS